MAQAGQSASLGVGATVIRSCKADTPDVISLPGSFHDMARKSVGLRCGGVSPSISLIPSISTSRADKARVVDQGSLTLMLYF
jgi:hypothetical protein